MRLEKAPIKVKEASSQDLEAMVYLGRLHQQEAAQHIVYDPDAVELSFNRVVKDIERNVTNLWLAYKDTKPVGYAIGQRTPYFFNFESSAVLTLLFVIPEERGSWTPMKLVKAYEEWARLHGCLQIYVGVARLEEEAAQRIGSLFSKIGYKWAGTYYIKETIR